MRSGTAEEEDLSNHLFGFALADNITTVRAVGMAAEALELLPAMVRALSSAGHAGFAHLPPGHHSTCIPRRAGRPLPRGTQAICPSGWVEPPSSPGRLLPSVEFMQTFAALLESLDHPKVFVLRLGLSCAF